MRSDVIYSTVFQVMPSPGPVGVQLPDLVTAFVAVLLVARLRARGATLDRRLRMTGYGVVIGLVLLTIWGVADAMTRPTAETQLSAAVQSGKGHTVEGPVEQFVPGSFVSKRPESFIVNGIGFHYSEGIDFGGFNETAERGGPMHEGLQVRIEYVRSNDVFPQAIDIGNVITRIEVAVPGS